MPSERVITLRSGEQLSADFTVECRWIDARLGIGGMVGTRRNARALFDAGVTHVIDLQEELDDGPLFDGLPVALRWLGVPDALAPFPEAALAEAVAFAEEARAGRLFVHCMAGRNRAPLFAWAILRARGVAADAAAAAIRAVEPAALLRAEHLAAAERVAAAERRRGGRT